jgi:hypothetical protein
MVNVLAMPSHVSFFLQIYDQARQNAESALVRD